MRNGGKKRFKKGKEERMESNDGEKVETLG